MNAACDVDLFDVLTLNFPCQRFSEASKTADSIAHHRVETDEARFWRKSICYDGLAIKKIAGCLKMWRTTMAVHSFDLGETVMVFQMSPAKGLMKEGLATVVELVEDMDEYYEVRFKADLDEYDRVENCPTYTRFLDREGSNHENPDQYIREFNNRIGYKAA